MARSGRRPVPAGVREKTEAVRSKREPKGGEAPAVAAPAPVVVTGLTAPDFLKPDKGLEIWERLAPVLASAKLLTSADAQAFGRYCRNFARWLKLQNELDTDGETYLSESAHGKLKRANPVFLIADRLERMLLASEDRFGLNPAERQRIMAARAQTGVSGDLFGAGDKPPAAGQVQNDRRPDDPASPPAASAGPIGSPIGLLN